MINIDTRLIELIPTIGSKAFAVLMVLAKYSNTKKTCFPSIYTIQQQTGQSKNSVYLSIGILAENGLIESEQLRTNGRFHKVQYRIKTELLSIFVGKENKQEFELKTSEALENQEVLPCPDLPHTVEPHSGLPCHDPPCRDLPCRENSDNKLLKNKLLKKQIIKKQIPDSSESEYIHPVKQEEKNKNSLRLDDFVEFYKAYGAALNRNSRKEALERWKTKARLKKIPEQAELIKKVEEYKNSLNPLDGDKYKQSVQVWINQERWLDDFQPFKAPLQVVRGQHEPSYFQSAKTSLKLTPEEQEKADRARQIVSEKLRNNLPGKSDFISIPDLLSTA